MTLTRTCDNCNIEIPKNGQYYTIKIAKYPEHTLKESYFMADSYESGGKLDYCESCTKDNHYDLWKEVNDFESKQISKRNQK